MTRRSRIRIDADRLCRLVNGESIGFNVAGEPVELVLSLNRLGWKAILRTIIEAMPTPNPRAGRG